VSRNHPGTNPHLVVEQAVLGEVGLDPVEPEREQRMLVEAQRGVHREPLGVGVGEALERVARHDRAGGVAGRGEDGPHVDRRAPAPQSMARPPPHRRP
jgi:hypothetical protein